MGGISLGRLARGFNVLCAFLVVAAALGNFLSHHHDDDNQLFAAYYFGQAFLGMLLCASSLGWPQVHIFRAPLVSALQATRVRKHGCLHSAVRQCR